MSLVDKMTDIISKVGICLVTVLFIVLMHFSGFSVLDIVRIGAQVYVVTGFIIATCTLMGVGWKEWAKRNQKPIWSILALLTLWIPLFFSERINRLLRDELWDGKPREDEPSTEETENMVRNFVSHRQ